MNSSVFRVGWLVESGEFHKSAAGKVQFPGLRLYGVRDDCFKSTDLYFCNATIAG